MTDTQKDFSAMIGFDINSNPNGNFHGMVTPNTTPGVSRTPDFVMTPHVYSSNIHHVPQGYSPIVRIGHMNSGTPGADAHQTYGSMMMSQKHPLQQMHTMHTIQKSNIDLDTNQSAHRPQDQRTLLTQTSKNPEQIKKESNSPPNTNSTAQNHGMQHQPMFTAIPQNMYPAASYQTIYGQSPGVHAHPGHHHHMSPSNNRNQNFSNVVVQPTNLNSTQSSPSSSPEQKSTAVYSHQHRKHVIQSPPVLRQGKSAGSILTLVEGLITPPQMRYPGGKGNTRQKMPKQVIELDLMALPKNVKVEDLYLQSEVLGFSKKVNDMVPIGILHDLKTFSLIGNNKAKAVYNDCILRFSSHSHGQKLAIRWTLFASRAPLCSIDSATFQTITERGLKKKHARDDPISMTNGMTTTSKKSEKWRLSDVKLLIQCLEEHGVDFEKAASESTNWSVSRDANAIEEKYRLLLK